MTVGVPDDGVSVTIDVIIFREADAVVDGSMVVVGVVIVTGVVVADDKPGGVKVEKDVVVSKTVAGPVGAAVEVDTTTT
jgi:hypothetical protein